VRPKSFDEPLDRGLLDIDQRTRANLFAWRGQFSPQFVEAILTHYGSEADVVLDPFAGSGTVLVEAARLGREVCGVEVNPAAAALARIYELCPRSPAEREHALAGTRKQLEDCTRRSAAELGRALAEVACRAQSDGEGALLDALVVQWDGSLRSPRRLEALFDALATRVRSLPCSPRPVAVSLGDARHLPAADGSVDFVLTSPPYINVFNYHHNYRSGAEALGWLPLVAARSEIGANRKFRQNRFLTVVQYCLDMALALAELGRTGRPGARAVVVIGRESNVHRTAIYNGAVLQRLAGEVVGLRTALVQERMFQNKFGRAIREDILHLELGPARAGDLVARARELGRAVLEQARPRTPADRVHYLDAALARASEVDPSPRFQPERARTSADGSPDPGTARG